MKTFEQIIAYGALAISLVFAARVVWQWVRVKPPSSFWTGGARMSRAGQVAVAAFFLGIALWMVTQYPCFILIAFPTWAVAYWAQYADTKRYLARSEERRVGRECR